MGVKPNVVTWTSVVSACAVAGRADVAEEVVARMRAAGEEPNVVTLTALIRAHGSAGRSEKAEAVMKHMLRHGPQPNEVSPPSRTTSLPSPPLLSSLVVTPLLPTPSSPCFHPARSLGVLCSLSWPLWYHSR